MKKIACFTAAALLLLAACTAEMPSENGMTAYFIGSEGGMERLEPQWLETPAGAAADELILLVCEAFYAYEGAYGQSPVPAGAGITVSRSGSVASVDFGAGFLEQSAGRRSLATAAVALSLLEIEGISYVYLSVEGEGYPPFDDRAVTVSSFVTDEAAQALLGQQ